MSTYGFRFHKKSGFAACLAAFVITATVLATTACPGSSRPVVRVFNWGDYIDEELLAEFTRETGIRVKYDTFAQNEDMYIKLKMSGDSYDVVFPSDYMIKRLISEQLIQPFDTEALENYQHIGERFRNTPWDPDNAYSVPYMWGTVGIVYDTTRVSPAPDSWNVLWDEQYRGSIFMMESQRDTIGLALKKLGYSLNSRSTEELNAARDQLVLQKPLTLAYVGDEVKDKMIGGEAALAVVYSGDAVYIIDENPAMNYVVPIEGSNIWFDGMVIPAASKNVEAALTFINFLCRPDVAARNAEYIGYSTPNDTALELLDESVRTNPAAYPSPDVLQRCEFFDDVSDALREYDRVWLELKSAR